MADLSSLGYKSILSMTQEERNALILVIRNSRRMPVIKAKKPSTAKKKKKKKKESVEGILGRMPKEQLNALIEEYGGLE